MDLRPLHNNCQLSHTRERFLSLTNLIIPLRACLGLEPD
jgi:hypothetical protein